MEFAFDFQNISLKIESDAKISDLLDILIGTDAFIHVFLQSSPSLCGIFKHFLVSLSLLVPDIYLLSRARDSVLNKRGKRFKGK